MKHLILFFSFLFLTTASMAQVGSSEPIDETTVIRITLAESETEQAKQLKQLQHGKLLKGENRYSFQIITEPRQVSKLKKELTTLFPNCVIESVGKKN